MMGLCPNKHIVNWKYHVKNALITPNFPNIVVHLKHAWNTYIGGGQNHLTAHCLFQHQKRVLYHISQAQERALNSKNGFYWMHIAFANAKSWKIISQTIVSWGPPAYVTFTCTCFVFWNMHNRGRVFFWTD